MSLRFANVRVSATGVVVGSSKLWSNGLSANIITAQRMTTNIIALPSANAFTGSYSTLSGTPVLPSVTDYGANVSTASNLAVINRPLQYVNNQGTNVFNTKLFTGTAQTVSNGTVTFYPTLSGSSGSPSLFSQILSVQCSLWQNTATATAVPNIAGKAISSDMSTVTFNVTTQQTGLTTTTVFAGAGVPCMCLVIGI